MYEAYFGLKEPPFQLCPDVRYLYLSDSCLAALSLLEHALRNPSGIAVLTGDAGSGKTSLIRKLQNHDSAFLGVVSCTNFVSFNDLLQWVLLAFEVDVEVQADTARLYRALKECLAEQCRQGRRAVLIIDESQNLSPAMIEALRLLTNLNDGNSGLLQLMLFGQTPLREILKDDVTQSFVHRVAIDCHLQLLDSYQTGEYINHRLKVAGVERALFTNSAISAVATASGGNPRVINMICEAALLFGFSEQLPTIGAELIRDVVDDKLKGLSSIGCDISKVQQRAA